MDEDFFNEGFNEEFESEGLEKAFLEKFREALYEEILSRAKSAADELESDGDKFLEDSGSLEMQIKIQFLDNALKLLEEVEEFERCSVVLKYKKLLEKSVSK